MPINDFIRQRVRPFAMALTSHFFLYSILSSVAVSAAILNALQNYSNFYSMTIYLSKSSRSVLILVNFGFLLALLCGRMVQRIFLGPLQAREVERLYDRLWFFVTESLLAFTIFRDEFDMPFAFMFGLLLFIKCFHWLMADRIDTMDQVPYPGPPPIFHVRMNCLCALLAFTDLAMFVFAVESTLAHGVGGNLLFASEYAILMASAMNSMAKYALSVVDLRRARSRGGATAPPWENKSMYVFYIELATDFLKLLTYLSFCGIIVTFYGLPLNVVRDVYMTSRSFITRLRALIRYRTATRNMDERYPNATEEEMNALSDRTCIICREEMSLPDVLNAGELNGNAPQPQAHIPDGPNMTPKKLPCGHIFHFHCLRSWLERQQSCPTCRRTVLETNQQGAQQAGQAGARPPAPQPGAAPIPPNFVNWLGGAPGQQPPPQGQLPQANGPGLLGRIFGVAQQPPIVPGQFAEGVRVEPLPLAWNPPPPMYFQQGPPQQPLQPVPIFQGFPGPNGVWQPWGMDQQWLQADLPGQQQGAQEQPTPTPTAQAPTNLPVNMPQATDDPYSAPIPGSQAQGTDRPVSPREAAAQAALRRYNSGTPRSENVSSDSGTSSSTALPSTSAAAAGDSSGVSAQSASNGPTEATSAASPIANGNARLEVPRLIPIVDLNQASIGPGPWNRTGSLYAPIPRVAGAHQAGRPASSQASRPASLQVPGGSGVRRSRSPLSRLPETLSEVQLARLDRITRDAIDERIRVLENVSGTVARCVEELLRVRSVLPAAQSAARSGQSTMRSNQASTQSSQSAAYSTQAPAPSQDSQAPSQNAQTASQTDRAASLSHESSMERAQRQVQSSQRPSNGSASSVTPETLREMVKLRDELVDDLRQLQEAIAEASAGESSSAPVQPQPDAAEAPGPEREHRGPEN
ncbi:hypothetical protein NEOLEDRAFT_1245689 [Neolentinus lepideus HHB14362 ss-1]|uniref:RING-type E3 ubiquitin transferase n=1 Tax=Neolentinus lepideus HHB14362 ss-1 TaxID=1314782 RepID=A0A165NJ03_9AGAM|nr:hypothetical protein NEOLEDRAFT_1245689 [Neolentinus lepideus HHB14362 ss-1]